MKRLPYLLVLVLTLALVDDTWAVAPGLLSAPLTDNDEYLTARQQLRGGTSSSCHQLASHRDNPRAAEPFSARRGVRPEWKWAAPFTPAPLYVFMSLQI